MNKIEEATVCPKISRVRFLGETGNYQTLSEGDPEPLVVEDYLSSDFLREDREKRFSHKIIFEGRYLPEEKDALINSIKKFLLENHYVKNGFDQENNRYLFKTSVEGLHPDMQIGTRNPGTISLVKNRSTI